MRKINFCVTQIISVKNLLEVINSDFFARVISRKIIVRIYDFINITRRYNKANVVDDNLRKNVKAKLNELNTEFENSLKQQRHKFSAHIQDLEFRLRIDNWTNISYENIIFFHGKIIEIYGLFENQPDYITINTHDLVISQKEVNSIQVLIKDKDIESRTMFSPDIFSITRYNSGAMIPINPMQDKVLTLNSIVIILDFEIALYNCFENIGYKHLLKTLIIIDIISFIDNIITPNDIDDIGLGELLEHRDILDKFLNVFNLDTLIEIRTIRNKIGAHIDGTDSYEDIIGLLEKHNFDDTLSIYKIFLNIFFKICNETFHLKCLLTPPIKIHGVTKVGHQPEKTFFDDIQIETEFIKNDINDIELYNSYLKKLFIGVESDEYNDIRYFFYDALAHSKVVNSVIFDNKNLELKKAHEFFISKLKSGISASRKKIILKLLNDCSNGYPVQLVYILITTYDVNKLANLKNEYILYLGNISRKHCDSAMLMLTSFLNSKDINLEYISLLSLLKIDIKSRGIDCVNKKLKIVENEYSKIIKEQLSSYKPLFKVFIGMLLSSEMLFNSMLGNYHKFFKEFYFDYFEDLIFENIELLGFNFSNNDTQLIKDAKSNNNLSYIFLIIAEKLADNEAELFYKAITNNLLKLDFSYLPFVEHLAYSKYKIDEIDEAIDIYKKLIEQNPDIIEYRIQLANYYLEKNDLVAFNKDIKYLEDTFKLTDEQNETLTNIKKEFLELQSK